MWPLAITLSVTIAALALRRTRWSALSLRVSRWSYAGFIVLALLYFPSRAGFRLAPFACEWKFGIALAAQSFTNYPHIILFAIFFLLTYAQLPDVPKAGIWSAAACIAMGFLVELAQGATRRGHCRMRDLIPDMAGALAGLVIVAIGGKLRSHIRAQRARP